MILMNSQFTEFDCESAKQFSAAGALLTNRQLFAKILQSQRQGKSCLPFHLGLSNRNYIELEQYLNDEQSIAFLSQKPPAEDLRQDLLSMRGDEWVDLRNLLIINRTGAFATEIWMAEIVAAACLGADHLWRDLGLPDRQSLSILLNNNFYPLAKENTKDMKWKKFFYKQLCEQAGSYICRAPSCEECKAYADCFGPEE